MNDGSLFGTIFGGILHEVPEPEIRPEYLQAIRAAANKWLKANPQDRNAGLVKAALLATNPVPRG